MCHDNSFHVNSKSCCCFGNINNCFLSKKKRLENLNKYLFRLEEKVEDIKEYIKEIEKSK